MANKSRRFYADEFKVKAIELAQLRGNTSQVARELDLRPELLSKWVYRSRMSESGQMEPLKSVTASLTNEQMQIRQLKEELEFTRMERDILKKAVSIFSKNEGVRTR